MSKANLYYRVTTLIPDTEWDEFFSLAEKRGWPTHMEYPVELRGSETLKALAIPTTK